MTPHYHFDLTYFGHNKSHVERISHQYPIRIGKLTIKETDTFGRQSEHY